jgi:carbon storage regulator CsrA
VLILTQRIEEAVTITCPDGREIRVKVLGVGHGDVRLGYDAPKDVSILRDNAILRKERET